MTPEIDQTVFSWSNFLLKLSRRQCLKQFVRPFHVGLPPAECGVDERILCSHPLPAFHLDELRMLSRACSCRESPLHRLGARRCLVPMIPPNNWENSCQGPLPTHR